MVLDGHDGTRAVKFAQSYIPHVLLQSELGSDDYAVGALKKAIVETDKQFFISIDPYITRKFTLQLEIEVSSEWLHESLVGLF